MKQNKCPDCNNKLQNTTQDQVKYCQQCNLDWFVNPDKEKLEKSAQTIFNFYPTLYRGAFNKYRSERNLSTE